MARNPFSLDTVHTEHWYRITYANAHGDTITVERPDGEAANFAAAVSETLGTTLVSFARATDVG